MYVNYNNKKNRWKKILAKRHMRMIYDLIIASDMSKKKYEYFVKSKKGEQFMDSLTIIENFRIYCKGKHTNTRIKGIIKSDKKIKLETIKKWRKNIDQKIQLFKIEREKHRNKYEINQKNWCESNIFQNNIENNKIRKKKKKIKYKSESEKESENDSENSNNNQLKYNLRRGRRHSRRKRT